MKDSNGAREVILVPLAKLKQNPRQAELFGDLTASQLSELATDMRQNGQLTPVEISPDYTIICGHQRFLAARSLDWPDIQCWMREDLSDPVAQERRLIDDNLHRKQLSELDVARCYAALKALETKQGKRRREGDLRDILAKQFGRSGKSLERLSHVLQTPRAVQKAYEAGTLGLLEAERVSFLPAADQQAIANSIEAGESPKAVVKRHAAQKPKRQPPLTKALQQLVRGLEAIQAHDGPIPEMSPKTMPILRKAPEIVAKLIKARERPVQPAQAQQDRSTGLERKSSADSKSPRVRPS